MLRYLKHSEIDFALWDACIRESPNGLIYALSWYLNIVSPGWDAIVKVTDGIYELVMPLPVARKFGIRFLKQPILTQQLGVFSPEPISADTWQQIRELLRQNFRVISRYAFNTANQESLKLEIPGVICQTYPTYHLDLHKTYAEIFGGYKKARKWRVNQAKKNALTVKPAENITTLFELFETHTAGKIYGFVGEGYTYKLVQELYAQAKATNTGEIYEVLNEHNEVLAMAFFTFFNRKIIYLFSTTTEVGRKLGAIPFLLDAMFEKYAGSGYTFDFEAPRPDGHGAKPIIDFYESFGPAKVFFVTLSFEDLPLPLKLLKQFRVAVYRKLLQK